MMAAPAAQTWKACMFSCWLSNISALPPTVAWPQPGREGVTGGAREERAMIHIQWKKRFMTLNKCDRPHKPSYE